VTRLAADPFVGRKVLGRYRVVRSIGRGGMGLIYLARLEGAANFVKPVVVKRAAPDLLAKEPSLLQVMGREARIMSHLHHPSIVSVIDFAEEDGAYLLVLDYVHGYHLGQWHRYVRGAGRAFPADVAIHIVCRVLDALHYAHTICGPDGIALGIVHRDVSPGNVLLDADGHVKLADFGIARMHSDQTETTDQPGLIKGKFAYMAPELLSRASPNPVTDVYAAAVVLHELLSGRNELRATGSIEATIARVVHHTPSRIAANRADVPKGLDDVLVRALAKSPDDRFRDAAELAGALRRVLGVPDDELDRRLAAAIAADFRGSEIATTLDVTDLATLDRAWRGTPNEATDFEAVVAVAQSRADAALERADAETVIAPVPTVAGAHGAARPSRAMLYAGGAAALVALGGAGFFLARPGPAPTGSSAVVVVNGQVSGVDGLVIDAGAAALAPEPVAPVVAAAAPPSSAPPASASHTPGAPARADSAEGLTRAFSRQQPQVASCFAAHASDVTGSPEIAIRFGVDTAGHVTAAQVLPPAVASTPLGACLATVAQATRFSPQARDVSFRIPIVARRTP
jgi:eukaryotic-like serine/threonine-protein kinase